MQLGPWCSHYTRVDKYCKSSKRYAAGGGRVVAKGWIVNLKRRIYDWLVVRIPNICFETPLGRYSYECTCWTGIKGGTEHLSWSATVKIWGRERDRERYYIERRFVISKTNFSSSSVGLLNVNVQLLITCSSNHSQTPRRGSPFPSAPAGCRVY